MGKHAPKTSVDRRTAAGRRLKQITAELSAGLDQTQGQGARSLIRSTASLQLRLERMQHASDRGGAIDAAALSQLTDTWRRSLRQITQLRRSAAASAPGSTLGKRGDPGGPD